MMEDQATPTIATSKTKYLRTRPNGGAYLRLPYEPCDGEFDAALEEASALGYCVAWEDENFEHVQDGVIEIDLFCNLCEEPDYGPDDR